MTTPNPTLHGNAPDSARVALLIIDMINDLDFPEGEQLLVHAIPMAHRILALKRRAKAVGIPIIYVNDNFGRWRSNFQTQVEHCLKDGVGGRPLAELLKPDDDDYFVLKPKHSGFFSTVLDVLLDYLGVETVILTGITGDICVLFTAQDAYLRDLRIVVPRDCVVSQSEEDNVAALAQMKRVLKADTSLAEHLDLPALNSRSTKSRHGGRGA